MHLHRCGNGKGDATLNSNNHNNESDDKNNNDNSIISGSAASSDALTVESRLVRNA